jgi:hypothetical protein
MKAQFSALALLVAATTAHGEPLTEMSSLASAMGAALDSDGDGVPDAIDNCLEIQNPPPLDCDTDQDGYGNMCDCDYNNDFLCGGPDFGTFLGDFGGPDGGTGTDQNCDGSTGGPDFGRFFVGWGRFTGPSGLSCAGTVPCP